mgnify:CR=1 FL=1
MAWDEEREKWAPAWGYDKVGGDEADAPIIEVSERDAAEGVDPREEARAEKKARVAKNAAQRDANDARARKKKRGPEPEGVPSGLPVDLQGKKKGKGASEDQPNPTDSGSDTQKDAKKKSKKGKKDSQENPDNQDAEDSKKSGRKRGRPSRNQSSSTTAASSATADGGYSSEADTTGVGKHGRNKEIEGSGGRSRIPDDGERRVREDDRADERCEDEARR